MAVMGDLLRSPRCTSTYEGREELRFWGSWLIVFCWQHHPSTGVTPWKQSPGYATYKSPYGPKTDGIALQVQDSEKLRRLDSQALCETVRYTPIYPKRQLLHTRFNDSERSCSSMGVICCETDKRHRGMTLGAFGGVAGVFAVFFFAEIPKVRNDIMVNVPFIGKHFIKEIPPSDNIPRIRDFGSMFQEGFER
ncbi:uncharacterized protein RAG0_12194 [Rhynchosporium agropyri]|uniref:Uncharacterized protein n=1 Tax=Rhynchosporium agropyri TaxID=914238 RepID=A0A1E1L7G4_9HELO|nr:uncharacterized protein RAG0_12194 [Rhynchosporium agropyri]